jgi:hypothetical protein
MLRAIQRVNGYEIREIGAWNCYVGAIGSQRSRLLPCDIYVGVLDLKKEGIHN